MGAFLPDDTKVPGTVFDLAMGCWVIVNFGIDDFLAFETLMRVRFKFGYEVESRKCDLLGRVLSHLHLDHTEFEDVLCEQGLLLGQVCHCFEKGKVGERRGAEDAELAFKQNLSFHAENVLSGVGRIADVN